MMTTLKDKKPGIVEEFINGGSILYDKPFLTAYYHPDKDYMLFIWRGKIEKTEYQEAFENYIEFFRNLSITKFIGDTEQMLPMNPEAQKYNAEVVMPALSRAGVRYAAVVVPESAFSALVVKRVLDKCMNLQTHYFCTLSKATAWIERC